MNNHILIFFCQRCQKEHDRTNEGMFDTSVRCDDLGCNGYVITPSGRANMQIRMTAGVYLIYGNTFTAWVAAHDKEEALELFANEIESTYQKIVKLNNQQLEYAEFMCDPSGEGIPENYVKATAKDLLAVTPVLPVIVFRMSNEELLNKREELFDDDFDDEMDES